jgi:DNA-binding CsgD family transcriptional regulator
MLEVAAVLGRTFDVADVARVLRCPVATLAPAVREALGADVLVDRGTLAFSGGRTHRAVYEAIPGAVRNALQVEVAGALLVGRHFAAVGGLSLCPDAVAEALERAADDAEVGAPRVAARLRLLAVALASGEDRRRPELTPSTVHRLARAGHAAQAQALAASSLRVTLPSELQAQRHLELATSLLDEGRVENALQHTTAAVGMTEMPGQLRASPWAPRRAAHCGLGDIPMTQPRWAHGRTLMLLDRLSEASVSFEGGRHEVERRGSGKNVTMGHACRASLMLQLGQLDEAWSEAQAGLESAAVLRTWEATAELSAVMVEVATLRGELDRAADLVRQAALGDSQGTRGGVALMWAIAHVEEERGEPRRAWTHVATVLGLLPHRLQGFLADPLGGARLARLAITVDDRRGALSAVAGSERLAALNPGVVTMEASAALARGMVHGDAARLQEGVGLLRSSGRPISLAWACEAAARQDGVLTNPARRRLLEQARVEYERVGATGCAAHAGDQLQAEQVVRAPRGAGISRADWQSLTSAELRIVAEVSRGLTNREVARRLFVSQNTVESHLKHIYPKLGIHSRIQLALMVATPREPASARGSSA